MRKHQRSGSKRNAKSPETYLESTGNDGSSRVAEEETECNVTGTEETDGNAHLSLITGLSGVVADRGAGGNTSGALPGRELECPGCEESCGQ